MRHFTTAAGERATARHDVSRRLGQIGTARHFAPLQEIGHRWSFSGLGRSCPAFARHHWPTADMTNMKFCSAGGRLAWHCMFCGRTTERSATLTKVHVLLCKLNGGARSAPSALTSAGAARL